MRLLGAAAYAAALGLVFSAHAVGQEAELSDATPVARTMRITVHRSDEIRGVMTQGPLRISVMSRLATPSRVVTQVEVGDKLLDAEVDLANETAILDGHGLSLSIEQIKALIAVGDELERYLDPNQRQPLPHEDMLYRLLSAYTLGFAGRPMGRVEVAGGIGICSPMNWVSPFPICGEPATSTEPELFGSGSCTSWLDCYNFDPDWPAPRHWVQEL